MYAPHFAAALAIKGRSPGAPLWALLCRRLYSRPAVIALARIGIEPAQTSNFFDDWSHSLVSVAVLAYLHQLSSGGASLLLSQFGWLCSRTSCSIFRFIRSDSP